MLGVPKVLFIIVHDFEFNSERLAFADEGMFLEAWFFFVQCSFKTAGFLWLFPR